MNFQRDEAKQNEFISVHVVHERRERKMINDVDKVTHFHVA